MIILPKITFLPGTSGYVVAAWVTALTEGLTLWAGGGNGVAGMGSAAEAVEIHPLGMAITNQRRKFPPSRIGVNPVQTPFGGQRLSI